jgi:1-acyl-sn-glycerol-3-phosphate acyltransferase
MTLRFLQIQLATLRLYIGTHLYVFVFLPYAILVSYVRSDRLPALKQQFVRTVFAIVGKRLRVSGRQHVRPDRAYVIISNYPSGYAGFALVGAFPSARLVAHAFIRNVPLLGQAMRRVGAVFVRPGRKGLGLAAIDMGLRDPEHVSSIIILPEGGRTPDGRIHRFRRGFVHILRQTELDLLPVTLNGLFQLKPATRIYADPAAAPEMIIHPPVSHARLSQLSDEGVLELAHGLIASVYRP